jgi:hypothetical protein
MAEGFMCDRCGFIAVGLFADQVFKRHVEKHLATDAAVQRRNEITDDDKTFLKVQKIAWEE